MSLSQNQHWSIMRDWSYDFPIYTIDRAVQRAAQASGAFGNGIQHRLNISRRAGNYFQYLAGRSLLLQGFGNIAVAILNSWNSRTFSMAITA